MIAFDASFVILALDPKAASREGTPHLEERISLLLEENAKARSKVVIPTPALSEFLAKADIAILDQIHDSAAFRIAPFDERAAIEAAELTKRSVKESDKRDPVVNATWAKIKFDRQIVAIAKVEGVDAIYSTDPDIAKHAKQLGLRCLGIADLPHPNPQPILPGILDEPTKQENIPPPVPASGGASGPPEGETGPKATKRGDGKNESAAAPETK
jgi:predicted nucleic acid-binding protein